MTEIPQIQRLNSMGQRPQKQYPFQKNHERQVGITYGHDESGKVYTYLGGEGLRAGDITTPEVTHPKSGKTYKTLGKVAFTRDSMGDPAGNTAAHLGGQGIMMKTIGQTNQKSLPGYYEGWGKDAQAAKELEYEYRQAGASSDTMKAVKAYTSGARQESKQKYEAKKMKGINSLGEVKK